MKSLALLRHAKSSWDDPSLRDFDRPLARRGEKAAILMGEEIARRGLTFDLVLASPARRAAETIDFLQSGLGRRLPVRFDDDLYTASVRDLFDIVGRLTRRTDKLLIVGHNSALQEFAIELADPDARDLLSRMKEHFPTAALACFTLAVRRWSDVRPGAGSPEFHIKPKELLRAEPAPATL